MASILGVFPETSNTSSYQFNIYPKSTLIKFPDPPPRVRSITIVSTQFYSSLSTKLSFPMRDFFVPLSVRELPGIAVINLSRAEEVEEERLQRRLLKWKKKKKRK